MRLTAERNVFAERRNVKRRTSRATSPGDDARVRQIERLESVIEKQQAEIASLELALAERSRLLKETQREMTRMLRDCDEAVRPRVERLLEAVAGGTTPSRSRRTFDEWFDQSKRVFVRKLSARFPKLTPTELKICSLLKLNLQTREIASLLHTSVRNIESHRYWIRKKLALPKSVNLSTFLTAV
jgi:DNA-binding CsgD family transcriptional regulator